ncbi:MAG: hypothetical protein ACYTXY_29450 [Nostoc sp.]
MLRIFDISSLDGTIILLKTELNAHLVKRGWRTAYLTLFKAIAWLLC